MTGENLPIIPVDPESVVVHELSENNASRSCVGCGGDAGFYVFATDVSVSDTLGVEVPTDSWPLNSMLCRSCFADAPRVSDIRHHPAVRDLV